MRAAHVAAPLAGLIATAAGHGAVVIPPPRQAADGSLAPWKGGVPYPVPFENWCPVSGPGSCGLHNLTGKQGQACFWFSNGCSIGCPECDGVTRGPIPNRPKGCSGMVPRLNDTNCKRKMDTCGKGAKATVCDPKLRTVNTAAECGADDDWYYYTPWRAPGSSPVLDSCGMAGGTPAAGGFGAEFHNTTKAKQGDLGTKVLPEAPSGTVWGVGEVVEVSWALQANHAGGYQYRLCPKSQPLTEECFFKIPLKFVGQQSFRWGGVGGEQFFYDGVYVSEGTMPEGSTWSINPIPRNDVGQTGQGFKPFCDEKKGCSVTASTSDCKCSGEWGPYDLEIVDKVQIPADIPPGEYVLGWRWDCEESNQIWQSCSDVTIAAHVPPTPPPAPRPPPTPRPTPDVCGAKPANNGGKELPGMPVAASSPCACAQLCDAEAACVGWTYSFGAFVKGGRNCFLRSTWGPAVDNCGPTECGGGCYSAPRTGTDPVETEYLAPAADEPDQWAKWLGDE